MCRWRQVCNVYLKCGHLEPLRDELIPCYETTCIFSPYHPRRCPNCKITCWQYRQSPQQYSPALDRFCSACTRSFRA